MILKASVSNGVIRSMHKQPDGSYDVRIKQGKVERQGNEPTLTAAAERLEIWYEEIVGIQVGKASVTI